MAYQGNVQVELMIPRRIEVAERLHGFYQEIGWSAINDPDEPNDTYVHPGALAGDEPPEISYWQTTSPNKVDQFVYNRINVPSEYSRGMWLPVMQQLVEVCLIVPDDEAVLAIFDRGGDLLATHAHVHPREHAGRREFRFTDPFNYSLRVTSPIKKVA